MTQLSKHWRRYLWVLGLLGMAAMGLLLWQLPFPANLLVVAMAFTLGGVRVKVEQLRHRIERLEKWHDTELVIEQDLARRTRGNRATH
jgi:hypothetical protein